jgi:hypothetical protein
MGKQCAMARWSLVVGVLGCLAAPAPQRAAAAHRSGLQPGGARLWLGLDRRRRMGEGSASGAPWGDSLGTGDWAGGGHEQ